MTGLIGGCLAQDLILTKTGRTSIYTQGLYSDSLELAEIALRLIQILHRYLMWDSGFVYLQGLGFAVKQTLKSKSDCSPLFSPEG